MTPRTVPLVSVIIPVLREAHQLDTLIDHLILIADGLPVELIVVDGSPDRETLKAISREGVRLLTAPAGRALQMNVGAAAASGNFLLFLHADTRLPRGAFRRIAETLSDGRHVAGAFNLRYGSTRPSIRLIAGAACIRSRLTRIALRRPGPVLPAGLFRTHRRIFGHPPDGGRGDHAPDQGSRREHFHLPEPVISSARRQEKEGVVYCTLRNWTILTLYFLGMSPERLVRFYKNH